MLAGFFGVSLDRLLGVDEAAVRQKRDGWLQAFRTALSRGAVGDGIRIARAGTAEFPNDFALLNKLMYALFLAGDEDGNSPDWREDRARFDAEIVALGEHRQILPGYGHPAGGDGTSCLSSLRHGPARDRARAL